MGYLCPCAGSPQGAPLGADASAQQQQPPQQEAESGGFFGWFGGGKKVEEPSGSGGFGEDAFAPPPTPQFR